MNKIHSNLFSSKPGSRPIFAGPASGQLVPEIQLAYNGASKTAKYQTYTKGISNEHSKKHHPIRTSS